VPADHHSQLLAARSSMQQGQQQARLEKTREVALRSTTHHLPQVKAKLKLSGVAEIYFSSVSRRRCSSWQQQHCLMCYSVGLPNQPASADKLYALN
jgi:hypothetical protein